MNLKLTSDDRDGLTATREIRRLEISGELPARNQIFALTGNARSGQVQAARDAGMDDVFVSLQTETFTCES